MWSVLDASAYTLLGNLNQAAPVSAAQPPIELQSVWDFVVRGGPTMIAIGVVSLVALTVVAERFIVLSRRNVMPKNFLAGLKAIASDRRQAIAFCEADGSPIAQILHAAIRQRGKPVEFVEKSVREAGSRVLVGLRRRMRMISALPQVSTMLGLLGTIFGMIKTFQAVATSGQSLGKAELLARGIFEAWTNTAAGLLVAIPVLIVYQVLMAKIDGLAVELDRVAEEWIEQENSIVSAPTIKSAAVFSAPPALVDGPLEVSRVALAGA
jgi:biopolymer transport protein ExbB